MTINIDIKNKQAVADGSVIVCGNSDYQIKFTFDEEWAGLLYKTARFVYKKAGEVRYIDVLFAGDTVDVPTLTEIRYVLVGVYTDELKTTSPAEIACEYSILCNSGENIEVYTQEDRDRLIAACNEVAAGQAAANAAAAEATASIELVREAAAEAVQAKNTAVIAAEEAVLATAGKQNKLAWVTDEDVDAMFDGSYEGVENDDPEALPVPVLTEAAMTALLETAEVGSVYKYVGETTDTYENGTLYIVSENN